MWSLGADQQFTEIHRMGRCGLQWRSNGVGRVDKVRGPLNSRQNLKKITFPLPWHLDIKHWMFYCNTRNLGSNPSLRTKLIISYVAIYTCRRQSDHIHVTSNYQTQLIERWAYSLKKKQSIIQSVSHWQSYESSLRQHQFDHAVSEDDSVALGFLNISLIDDWIVILPCRQSRELVHGSPK